MLERLPRFLNALVALALCAVYLICVAEADAARPRILWKQPVKPDAGIRSSPDGTSFVAITPSGEVTCYSLGGGIAWRKRLPGVTDVIVGHGGAYLLAFAHGSPKRQRAYMLDHAGRLVRRSTPLANVTCADLARNQPMAAIGTSSGHMHVFSPTRRGMRYRRWRLPGKPVSVSFGPRGEQLIVGLKDRGGVGAYTPRGQSMWFAEGEPGKAYRARFCATGAYVLFRGFVWGGDSNHLGVLTPDGKLVWSLRTPGLNAVCAISYPGDYVAFGFGRTIEHASRSKSQRFVRLYSLSGRRLWEKGGMLFRPNLLTLTPSGLSVVSDSERSLAVLDTSGRRVGHVPLPATLRSCAEAPNSGRLLVRCGDGWIYLIHAGD